MLTTFFRDEHEIFRKTLGNLHQFTGGSFKGWLFRIADNALNDLDRARRQIEPLDPDQPLHDPQPGPEDAVIASLDRDQLRAALVSRQGPGVCCACIAPTPSGFTGGEVELVGRLASHITEGLRRALLVAPYH